MKPNYVLGLILSLSLVPALPIVHAAGSPHVFLSEINWAGSSKSTADEWIELSNSGGAVADIGGWQLTGVGTSGSNLVIPANTLLDVNQTYLIANYALGDPKTTLTVKPNLVMTAVSIPNSSLKITVLDASGNVIDALTDPGSPDFGSSLTFTSMERDPSSLLWKNAGTSTNLDGTQLGTPGIFTPVPLIITAPIVTTPPITETPPPQTPIIETTPEIIVPTTATITPAPIIDPVIQSLPVNPTVAEPIPDPVSDPIPTPAPATISNPIPDLIPNPVSVSSSTPTVIIEAPSETLISSIAPIIEPVQETPTDNATLSTPTVQEPTVITEAPEEILIVPTQESLPESPISFTDTTNVTNESNTTDSVSEEQGTETITVAPEPIITPQTTGTVLAQASSSILPGDLIISELLPSPSTGADEWIELENTTDASVSLEGLTLVDASGKITTLTGSIDANGFVLIANPSGKLNNDGDSITLTNLDESILDSVSYGTNSNPVPKKDESLSLIDGSWIITSSTPGIENITPIIATIEPTLTPTLSPTLYANTGTGTLASTTTTNTANTAQIYAPTRSVSIGTTHVAPGTQAVTTTHSTPKLQTSVALKTSSTTTKISKMKTSTVKKSATKKSTALSAQSIILDDIATLADETKVIIKGTVITTPGLIGKRSFFIDGLEIYQGTGVLADIHIGDEVKITGTLSVLSDHRRINIAEGGIAVLNHTEPIVHDYSSSLPFGSLIRITGAVNARDGDGILLKTDGLTVKIISATGVIIDWTSFAGANITATGILKHGNQETITLRSPNDLVKNPSTESAPSTILAGTTGSSSGFSSFWTLGAFLSLASAGFGAWVWYTRPKLTKSLFTLHPKTV